MSKRDDLIKEHFAQLCETLIERVIDEFGTPFEDYSDSLSLIASMALNCWNLFCQAPSYEIGMRALDETVAQLYNNEEKAKKIFHYVAELKWHEYHDDNEMIANFKIKKTNGKYRVVAIFLKDDANASEILNQISSVLTKEKFEEIVEAYPPEEVLGELESLIKEHLGEAYPEVASINVQAVKVSMPKKEITPDLPPEAISCLRKSMKLTQAKFGELLNATARTVSQWEHGKSQPNEFQKSQIRKFWNE